MKLLAYIPNNRYRLIERGANARIAAFWTGRVEAGYDAVTVHPDCRNRAAIEARYSACGADVVVWPFAGNGIQRPEPKQSPVSDGCWAGEDVVIVGGGPSLVGFDWHRLHDFPCRVIAINKALAHVVEPDLIYGIDTSFFERLRRGQYGEDVTEAWTAAKCPTVACLSRAIGDARVHQVLRTKNVKSRSFRNGVFAGGNSGLSAIHLATLMGARRIFLLGIDCLPTDSGKTAHFHGGYNDRQKCSVYEHFKRSYQQAADELKQQAQIINCNASSGVDCFEFGELPDGQYHPAALDLPRIITYTTPDYEDVYNRHLGASLLRIGIECERIQTDKNVSWKRGAAHKAIVMRDEYTGVPLVWLDADAEVDRFPVMLGGACRGYDFAAHWLQSGEMLSSLLYFGGSDRANRLINEWADICTAYPDKYSTADQRHLQDIVESIPDLRVMRLPASYCKIFDRPEHAGIKYPAITQYQASRQKRRAK
jgi:hypothetical protein